jgi:hypothetical protein
MSSIFGGLTVGELDGRSSGCGRGVRVRASPCPFIGLALLPFAHALLDQPSLSLKYSSRANSAPRSDAVRSDHFIRPILTSEALRAGCSWICRNTSHVINKCWSVIKRMAEREKFAHDFVLKTNNNLLKQANTRRLTGREKISSSALVARGLNTWGGPP